MEMHQKWWEYIGLQVNVYNMRQKVQFLWFCSDSVSWKTKDQSRCEQQHLTKWSQLRTFTTYTCLQHETMICAILISMNTTFSYVLNASSNMSKVNSFQIYMCWVWKVHTLWEENNIIDCVVLIWIQTVV